MMAICLATIGAILLLAPSFCVGNKMQPHYRHDELQYENHESAPFEQSSASGAWITGPDNNKYQFHIGKQSWLAAREKCLAQNADLITVETPTEMQWLLTHYRPQFRYLRERQVQIGLLLEAPEGDGAQAREWRWVNGKPLDANSIKWTQGEPFDHAKGKERCALLNINEQRIDDVDCDLGAKAEFNYRFVCQRSHEKHLEHESLNNPLWKKLEDILTFFGISSPEKEENTAKNVTLKNGLDEEGYWDKVFRTNANVSLEQRQKEEQTKVDPKVDVTHLPEKELAKGNLTEKNEELEKEKESQEKVATFIQVESAEAKNINKESTITPETPLKSEKILDEKSKEDKTVAKIIREDDDIPNNKRQLTKAIDGAEEGNNNFVAAASTDNNATSSEKGQKKVAEEKKKLEEMKEEKKEDKKKDEKKEENKKEEKKEQSKEEKKEDEKKEEKEKKEDKKKDESKEEKKELRKEEKNEEKKEDEKKEEKKLEERKEEKNEEKKEDEKKEDEKKEDEKKEEKKLEERKEEKNEEKKEDEKKEDEKKEEKKLEERKEEKNEEKKEDEKKEDEKKEDEKKEEKKLEERKEEKKEEEKKEKKVVEKAEEKNELEKEISSKERSSKLLNTQNKDEEKNDEKSAEKRSEKKEERKTDLAVEKPKIVSKEETFSGNKLVGEKNSKKSGPEIIAKTKSKPILVEDKHLDGRHGSNEGLEIVTAKKAAPLASPSSSNSNSTSLGDEKTMILLASAEEKSEPKANVGGNGNDECSRANSAACIRAHEQQQSTNISADSNNNSIKSKNDSLAADADAPKPIVLHAIGAEAEGKTNGTQKDEDRKEKVEAIKTIETNQTVSSLPSSAAASAVKPTKPDPLSVVAETLERTLNSKEEYVIEGNEAEEKKKEEGELAKSERRGDEEEGQRKKASGSPVQSRIKHLEQIITAVQKMMGLGGEEGNLAKESTKIREENGKKENEEEKEEKKTEEKVKEKKVKKEEEKEKNTVVEKDGQKKNAFVAEAEESSKAVGQSESSESKEIKNTKNGSNEKKDKGGEEKEENTIHDLMAMEGDFEEAEREGKAHPGINSGDLVKNIIMSSEEKDDDCFVECGKDDDDDDGKEEEDEKEDGKKKKGMEKLENWGNEKNEEEKPKQYSLMRKGNNRIEKYGRKNGGNDNVGGEKFVVLKGNLPMEKLEAKQQIEGIRKEEEKKEKEIHGKVKEGKSPTNENILDQLLHHNGSNKKEIIRDGDEIPPSAEIVDKIGQNDGEKLKQTGKKETNLKSIESKERNVDSKADDDWVLQLNKSTQNEGAEDEKDETNKIVPSTTFRSVFPQPDFSLIQRGIVPEEVEQNLQEESNRIRHVYNMFNGNENVYNLIRQMQQAEAAQFPPLAVDQSKMVPKIFGKEIGKNVDAEIENKRGNRVGWESSRDEQIGPQNSAAGNNFKQFIGGSIIVQRP